MRKIYVNLTCYFNTVKGDEIMRKELIKILSAVSVLVFLFDVLPVSAASRLRGKALRPGDCIGVIAPASTTNPKNLSAPLELLKSYGYRVKVAESCSSEHEIFAGTDEQRAEELNEFFRDDDVKAILCMRGGYGSARILDLLDYGMIAAHPKALIGYSDITALHTVLGEKSGIVTVHGPMFLSLAAPQNSEYTHRQFFGGLRSTKPAGRIQLPAGRKLETVIAGTAEGVIMGGNLSIIASLAGTPYELDGTGALLLIEEIGEKPYRIDRMMNQLWQNGLLNRVNGILIGDFIDCRDNDSYTFEHAVKHYARLSKKPVIKGIPAGHGKDNAFIPFGVHAVMKGNKDGTASLVIDEAAFSK